MSAPNLTRLVKRVSEGDRAAFATLYRCTAGRVHALVCRVLPDGAASAEVTQEVYVRAWSSAHTFDQARHTAENWLLALAHRCAVERVRAVRDASAQPAGQARDATGTEGAAGTAVDDGIAGAPSTPGARAAIDLLTHEQAAALDLAYLRGATHAESAQALGVDRATFRIRLGSALSRLRQGMDSGGDGTSHRVWHIARKS